MKKSPLQFEGLRKERTLASPQFDGETFRNPTGKGPGIKGNPLPLFSEYIFGGAQRTPPGPLPVQRPHEQWKKANHSGLRVTWLGHATTLLEMDGFTILTDPVFGERASPFRFAGPKRFHPVPAALEELPPLDAILLSHDHYDHLCQETMLGIARGSVPIITSLGVGARLEALGVAPERITELDWNESADINGVRFTATPSQHFSGRGLGDRNKTLWSSWVIQSEEHRVFFSGDTGLTEQFLQIANTYGPFDLVMLEIGAYNEAWGDIHLGPENALKAFQMLGGGTLLPIHWGTFNLALHGWDEPAETLVSLASKQKLRILTPQLGQVFEPSQVDSFFPWWRDVAKS